MNEDHKATILVVDDDPTLLDSLRDFLHLSGFRVLAAANGLDALAILEREQPDLILADITMPGMNGYQFYHRVRHQPEWLWIPFIFLSARDEKEDIRLGKEVGADDYLRKPLDTHDLIAAVTGRLDRFRQLRQDKGAVVHKPASGSFQIGEKIVVDLARHQVTIADHELAFSPTEFTFLERLIQANGAVVDYEELLESEAVDNRDAAELLRYHVRNLRHKLREAGGDPDLIVNVRGVGYRLGIRPKT